MQIDVLAGLLTAGIDSCLEYVIEALGRDDVVLSEGVETLEDRALTGQTRTELGEDFLKVLGRKGWGHSVVEGG